MLNTGSQKLLVEHVSVWQEVGVDCFCCVTSNMGTAHFVPSTVVSNVYV